MKKSREHIYKTWIACALVNGLLIPWTVWNIEVIHAQYIVLAVLAYHAAQSIRYAAKGQ